MIVYTKEYLINKCITYNNKNQIIDMNYFLQDEISTSKVELFIKTNLIDHTELQNIVTEYKLTIYDKKTRKIIIDK